MTDRLSYQSGIYEEYELSKACPVGWRIPNTYDWIRAIEHYTRDYYKEVALVNSDELFNKFAEDNSYFWSSPTPKNNRFTAFKFSDANSRVGKSFYIHEISHITSIDYRSSKLWYVVCIRDLNKKDVITSDNTVKDIEGNIYRTVKIGNKIWMNDNLATSLFSNGDSIPTTKNDICDEDKPIYQWNDLFGFGKVYTGYAVTDKRNLCPDGWHVSTEQDWSELYANLEEDVIDNDDSTNIYFMKVGFKSCNGEWLDDGYAVCCWTKQLTMMSNGREEGVKQSESKGLSVRCVKN